MPLPTVYRSGSEANINVDFTDFASGTGYVTFYGGRTQSGATVEYILSNNTFASDLMTTHAEHAASATWVKMVDQNFDVKFLRPQIIDGDAIIEIPAGWTVTEAGSVNNFGHQLHVEIDKVSAGTQTYLISGSSTKRIMAGMVSALSNTSQLSKVYTLKLTVPNTHFKINDTLRLNVKLIAKGDGSLKTRHGIAHDPVNRDDLTENESTGTQTAFKIIQDATDTVLKMQVPFKVDI